MRKLLCSTLAVTPLCLVVAQSAGAQEDRLSIRASLQQLWDSNYSRTIEEESDRVTLATASVAVAHRISRQQFRARWQAMNYQHAEREDLDTTIYEGLLSWRGEWGSKLSSRLEWVRDAYPVDRLEFYEKDVVTRDDLHGKLSYGAGHRMVLSIGGRQTNQTHSNDLREGLDYDEEEVFIEAGYKTGLKSTIFARVKYGEREYPNERLRLPPEGIDLTPDELEFAIGDLDYSYQQAELENTWVVSEKTSISATIGYFNRDGAINTNTGGLVTLQADWEMTPKIQLSGGYTLRQPAIGETSDSPTDIHQVFADALWQWTEKVSLATGGRITELHYARERSPGGGRNETVYNITPLVINYDMTNAFSMRLTTAWIDRQSPLAYRNYTSSQVNFGVHFRY